MDTWHSLSTQLMALKASLGDAVDWKQIFLMAMTPLFLLAFLSEWWVMRQRQQLQQFHLKDIMANFALGGSYQLFELLVYGLFVGPAIFWFWDHRFFTLPINLWTILPIFIAVEFCYYWFHRTSHRVRWFWSAHVVHHSSEHMNMSTAMRQSMLYPLTGWWLFFMPLVLLGVHPVAVFLLYAVNLAYQFFIHTEAVGKLHPILEYWLDTPSNHRAHHGRNAEYIDKNYGGVLIVFDRWFGTYVEEDAPVDYGIVGQVYSHNPIVLNLHEFIAMWRDVFRRGSLRQRLKHFWAPPEYERPAESAQADPSDDVPLESGTQKP
ncbi:MAG: sterol desaturase family protein [Neisseriaceae bacterium]|nr:sterol desaturase family protein [Neisseriaceae bacterium]